MNANTGLQLHNEPLEIYGNVVSFGVHVLFSIPG